MTKSGSENIEIAVKSISEYVNVILEKKRKLEPEGDIWFRGQGSMTFKLRPNLYRKILDGGDKKKTIIRNTNLIKRLEGNIDMSFSRKAFSFFSKRSIPDTPWYRYFLKQHYKLHTRLLDWTESALIALFFALEDQTIKEDAQVLILSPSKLNNYSINKLLDTKKNFHLIPSCSNLPKKGEMFTSQGLLSFEQLLRKYYWLDCDEDEKMFPIAMYPPHLDERMSAQQACFTLFGNVIDGLNTDNSKEIIIDYVQIDAGSKGKMLKDLKALGINYYSIYPDLDGLGKSINEEFIEEFENAKLWDSFENFFS